MAKAKVITTDSDIDAALARARAGGIDQQPVAEWTCIVQQPQGQD